MIFPAASPKSMGESRNTSAEVCWRGSSLPNGEDQFPGSPKTPHPVNPPVRPEPAIGRLIVHSLPRSQGPQSLDYSAFFNAVFTLMLMDFRSVEVHTMSIAFMESVSPSQPTIHPSLSSLLLSIFLTQFLHPFLPPFNSDIWSSSQPVIHYPVT